MDASHIDDLVASVLALHERQRLAHGMAARPVSDLKPAASTHLGSGARAALAALALSTTCAVMATAGIPDTAAASSPDTASSDPVATEPVNAVPAHVRPDIRPVLSDEQRLAALQEGKRLRSLDPAAAAALTRSLTPLESGVAKASTPTGLPADGSPVFALVTDITRTRIASELRQQLMASSATVGDLPGTPRAELMQVGAGWRAVVWPFATESEADKARRMLAERGIRTELLKF